MNLANKLSVSPAATMTRRIKYFLTPSKSIYALFVEMFQGFQFTHRGNSMIPLLVNSINLKNSQNFIEEYLLKYEAL